MYQEDANDDRYCEDGRVSPLTNAGNTRCQPTQQDAGQGETTTDQGDPCALEDLVEQSSTSIDGIQQGCTGEPSPVVLDTPEP